MIRTLRFLLLGVLITLAGSSFAQGIYGRVLNEKKEPIPSAIVQAFQGGIVKGGAATDYDGNYEIKPLEAGYYFLVVTYLGYDTERIKDVIVPASDEAKVDFTMQPPHAVELKLKREVSVRTFKKPLVGTLDHTISREEIRTLPTTQVADAAATAPGSYQSKRGGEINMGGARVEGTLYIIDGVQVQYIAGNRSGVDMSQGAVEEIEVVTSGIEAKYGDVSGGVVNITTRGVSQRMTGNVRVERSIDGYNNNLMNFSIAGPLFKHISKDDPTHTKKPVMGFALSGDYYDDHNRYPSYYQDYVMKDDVLKGLLANPLKVTTDNTGSPKFFYASNYITSDQMKQVKVPPNNELKEYRLNGKIDYQPVESIHIVGGASIDYVSKDLYGRTIVLFAPQAIQTQNNLSGRGFLRFTQKFGKANDTTHSIVSNAYYTLQADFQRESTENIDKKFGKDFFKYAYIGKFNETFQDFYLPFQKDSATGRVGTTLVGKFSNGFTFQRSEFNPDLANYTSQLYNFFGANQALSLNEIRNYNGLLNGDEPSATYSIKGAGLYASPGATQDYYSIFKSDQYALSVDASFDLKTGKLKHAVQFGLYYQQRVVSDYVVVPSGLWSLMRSGYINNVDNGGLYLDKTHPMFIVGGKTYTKSQIDQGQVIPGTSDTIIYNYLNKGSSTFDKNYRKKMHLSDTANINVEGINPSDLSLDMFSADQMLNSGHGLASYYGYTYYGTPQTGTVNFTDFWTKKDANGDYTRPIGAFTPNYVAGYIQDKFRYENIKFNIGVRVDRYSSNTKVLIDPYSEYPEKNVSQVSGNFNSYNNHKHPANIGSNYIVYIDDNSSTSPSIIGYRDGGNWYDPKGNYIEDPSILKSLYSGGRDPQPYILDAQKNIKITDTNFNPNLSFTDYTPQVNIMPRIQFSFPISEEADFFAHYDIYCQRPYPNSIAISTPATWYFLQANNTTIFPNADLKPTKTFDYEVGFQQKLTEHSAMTITGFYKERKDMVTVIPYLEAWPTTYYTYGNRDFSTTKGATFNFDYRTTNNLRMNLSYTLQFAEGSGSSVGSNSNNIGQGGGLLASFIAAGLPNLRYVTALDYDSRHNFAVNIDYRYKDGEGPMIGNVHLFENAGIDVIGRARSGEPYTRYMLPDNVSHSVIGGINTSRLPWHYGVDMRIDKDIKLAFTKKGVEGKEGLKVKQPKFIKIYVFVQNLFNIQDIMGVYGYTGKAGDDGYLASAYGQQYVPQQVNPKTFAALYNLYVNDPGHYNYARTINLGLEFNF